MQDDQMNGVGVSQASGAALEWTQEEQSRLEDLLKTYPMDKFPPVERYLRIHAELQSKPVREIALRIKWMANKLEYQAQQQLLGNAPNPNEARLQKEKEQRERERERAEAAGREGTQRDRRKVEPKMRRFGDEEEPFTGPSASLRERRERNVVGGSAPPTEAARTGGASTPTNPLGDGGNPFTRFGPLVNNLPPIPATQHPDHFKSEGIAETPFFGILSDNVSLMHQIRTQLLQGRLNDNVPMLLRFRENLFQLVASMSQVSLGPHPLRPMPIRLDVGLADSYLGKSLSAAGTQTMALAAAEISASAYTLQPGGGAPMPTFYPPGAPRHVTPNAPSGPAAHVMPRMSPTPSGGPGLQAMGPGVQGPAGIPHPPPPPPPPSAHMGMAVGATPPPLRSGSVQ